MCLKRRLWVLVSEQRVLFDVFIQLYRGISASRNQLSPKEIRT